MPEELDLTLSAQGHVASPDPVDTPLLAVLRSFDDEGFSGQFDSRERGTIHCFTCGEGFPAERCRHGNIRRLEGASDPADMLAVVPVRCPNCGTRGAVVANYGPEATSADVDMLLELDRVARIRGADG